MIFCQVSTFFQIYCFFGFFFLAILCDDGLIHQRYINSHIKNGFSDKRYLSPSVVFRNCYQRKDFLARAIYTKYYLVFSFIF